MKGNRPSALDDLMRKIDASMAPATDARPKVTWEPNLIGMLEPDGSVRVKAGRCGECRHWVVFAGATTDGRCAQLSNDGAQPVSVNDAWTTADFGCVLWERKVMSERHFEFRNEILRVMRDGKVQGRVVATDIDLEATPEFVSAFLDWADANHPAAFQVTGGGHGRTETTWEPEAAKAAIAWIQERWEGGVANTKPPP